MRALATADAPITDLLDIMDLLKLLGFGEAEIPAAGPRWSGDQKLSHFLLKSKSSCVYLAINVV
jgi:hypothetical protein